MSINLYNPQGKAYNTILLSFLIILMIVGTFLSFHPLVLRVTGIKTEGMVMQGYSFETSARFITPVSFTDEYGTTHTLTVRRTGHRFALEPYYSTGEKVTVYYNENNPQDAVIWTSMEFLLLILSLIGPIIVVSLSIFFFRKMLNKNKKFVV
jgi:hypothetical protein